MNVNKDNSIVEVHDLMVSYNKKQVLWGIDFSLPKGKLVCIIGPNGAGKSTLVKAIMGLVNYNSGYIKLFNQPISQVRKKISYVPQRETVDWDFPASAMDVVLMGRYGKLGLFKRLRKADYDVAEDSLRKVGMLGYKNRQISQLSGGQQQRVFLARALAQEAELYFLDEPFSGVDIASEKTIIQILKDMALEGKTIVVVHHNLQSVNEYFDWVILLNLRLIASGSVDNVFTQSLLEETYGGKLTLLSEVGELIKKERFPSRES